MDSPAIGFVIAMRARIARGDRKCGNEWVIVARWGVAGAFLSLSYTGVRTRGAVAPIGLKPRRTALARLARPSGHRGQQIFLIMPRLPRGMALAGEFLRGAGILRLNREATRLAGEGGTTGKAARSTWRLVATRAAWSGEFIEPVSGDGA